MSRSYRRTPIFGMTTAPSERQYKADEHQRERHHVRQRLRVAADDADHQLHRRAFGNRSGGPKDGRDYWSGAKPKDMRK